MPNWVAVVDYNCITAVAQDGREPRIWFRFKIDMRIKMRRLPAKYTCLPNPGELGVERVLQRVKLFAGSEVTR